MRGNGGGEEWFGVEDLLEVLPGVGAVAAGDVVEPDAQARDGPGDQQAGGPAGGGAGAVAGGELPGQGVFLF